MPSRDRQGPGARGWAIFAVASLGFLLSQFYRVSATVISPQLSQDLGLDVSGLGTLSAAFFYAFALSQIPLGLFLDRVGARRAVAALSLAGLAGAALFAGAQGLGQALAGRALLGVGMSCNLMGALALLAAWFPPGLFATLSGLLVSLGYVGNLLAATPLALMTQAWGWRWAFLAVAGLNVLQVAAFWLVVRDQPAGRGCPARLAKSPFAGLGEVLLRPAFWGICLGSFFRYGCFMALTGLWAGPYLITALSLGEVGAGNVLLALSVGHILALPLSGYISDTWLNSRKWAIAPSLFASALLTLALGLPGVQASPWLVGAVFTLIGLAAAPGQIMYAHVKELAPPERQGLAMTGINLFTMLGPAVVMQAVGLVMEGGAGGPGGLADPAGYWPAWWLMAGGLALAGAVYLFLPDRRPRGR
ncbi:MAG: MFS transporter [Desulfarculus sp.]|nr:MFS transporter [Desulfarculus sp.]